MHIRDALSRQLPLLSFKSKLPSSLPGQGKCMLAQHGQMPFRCLLRERCYVHN